MMSSTRRIISAASVAESRTCNFTLKDSNIPRSRMSPTCHMRETHKHSDNPHVKPLFETKNWGGDENDNNTRKQRDADLSSDHIYPRAAICVRDCCPELFEEREQRRVEESVSFNPRTIMGRSNNGDSRTQCGCPYVRDQVRGIELRPTRLQSKSNVSGNLGVNM